MSHQELKENLSHVNYWDDLSKLWLTKSALKELTRRFRATQVIHTFSSNRKLSAAADFLRSCQPAIIKDIKDFAKHGGPDLSDIRNYPHSTNALHPTLYCTMSPRHSTIQRPKNKAPKTIETVDLETDIATTRNSEDSEPTITTVYSKNFSQHLIDHSVYPNRYQGRCAHNATARQDLNERLTHSRLSLHSSKFSDNAFERFAQADEDAVKEAIVKDTILPIIEGRVWDSGYRATDISFTNLNPLTNGTLKPAKPGVYYGAQPEQLDRKIRQDLNGYIVPATQDNLPLAPNFFLEAKGQSGGADVVRRQVRYNGALGARGIHHLRSYGQKKSEEYDNHPGAVTSTYLDGQLKIYSHHITKPSNPGGRPGYHMSQVGAYAMTNDRKTFREGATAYRNARDWAKEQREGVIKQANQAVMSKTTDQSLIPNSVDNNDSRTMKQLSPPTKGTQSEKKQSRKRPKLTPPTSTRPKRVRRD